MKIKLVNNILSADLIVMAVTSVADKNKSKSSTNDKFKCTSAYYNPIKGFSWAQSFAGNKSELLAMPLVDEKTALLVGLGDAKSINLEQIRRSLGQVVKQLIQKKITTFHIDLDSFTDKKNAEDTFEAIAEAVTLANYQYVKYKSNNKSKLISEIIFVSKLISNKNFEKIINEVTHVSESIHLIRDYINESPSELNSETYAKLVVQDAQKLKKVKIKVLNKKEIVAEKMNLFLSVNAGSAFEPRLVHLTYTPSKMTKNTKHIALVGKGVTFDTGGYSLKTNMVGMKGDMAGSATVYGAFRSAVLNHCSHKITCIMVLTDNKINSHATVPDTITTGRNGKTVENLNTDAEGRLILADALDYACDLKPDAIIDAATLTGACLVALGKEVCAILGNDQKLIDQIKNHAKIKDEYIWQLPIIQEYRDDIKSKIADIKNIGSPMRAGTAIGAAFLEHFIKNDIAWAHLDIAGVSEDQVHLGYCPTHGASGVMVRTLYHYLMNS